MKTIIVTAALVVGLSLAPVADAWRSAYWQTPSRNIRCLSYDDRLVCGTLNDGYAITLFADGATRVQGNVRRIRRGPILQYGQTWSSKWTGIECESETVGLTCTNDLGHGFFLNRDDVERW